MDIKTEQLWYFCPEMCMYLSRMLDLLLLLCFVITVIITFILILEYEFFIVTVKCPWWLN